MKNDEITLESYLYNTDFRIRPLESAKNKIAKDLIKKIVLI